MNTKPKEIEGLPLAGGITVANLAEYKKKGRTIARNRPKAGRNEACRCGSGKKTKRCHP